MCDKGTYGDYAGQVKPCGSTEFYRARRSAPLCLDEGDSLQFVAPRHERSPADKRLQSRFCD